MNNFWKLHSLDRPATPGGLGEEELGSTHLSPTKQQLDYALQDLIAMNVYLFYTITDK